MDVAFRVHIRQNGDNAGPTLGQNSSTPVLSLGFYPLTATRGPGPAPGEACEPDVGSDGKETATSSPPSSLAWQVTVAP